MPFYNYRFAETGSTRTYERRSAVRLAGAEGILAQYLKTLDPGNGETVTWGITGSELSALACACCDNPHRELFLDLYPEGLVEVCLHRVERIVGRSEDDWTDAVIVTRPILVGAGEEPACELREHFEIDTPFRGREAMEAFGIRGGYQKGTYKWTKAKMNIGAAVCGGTQSCGCKSEVNLPKELPAEFAAASSGGCGGGCSCGGNC